MSAPSDPAAKRPRLAVALAYDGREAPRVTAKGRGEVADAILATAREHGVPVEDNALLAEALSHVELDSEIPAELYEAAAQVIAFVLRLSERHRAARPAP